MRDIETIGNSLVLLRELKKQNLSFDLKKFYLESDDSFNSGAVQIIMPNHKLSCFANKSHMVAMQNVCKLIYDDFDRFSDEVWQEEICDMGNVLFQFCSNGFSIAWFPKKITSFQLKCVNFNCALIEEINNSFLSCESLDKGRFKNRQRSIAVETNLLDDNGDILSLKEAMPIIKKLKL